MTATKDAVVRSYAKALFAALEAEGDPISVEDELYAFAKAIEANAALREALTDPALPAERKRLVIADLLGPKANPHTANVLGFLVEQGRGRDLAKIIEAFAEVAAEERQHRVAEVRSAVPLGEAKRKKLAAALSRATGKTVEIKVVVDPSVIGGVVARVGDEVFDGTVRTRLRNAGDRLRGA